MGKTGGVEGEQGGEDEGGVKGHSGERLTDMALTELNGRDR